MLRFNFSTSLMSNSLQDRAQSRGTWGAGLLGMIFALSFCPVSAAVALLPVNIEGRRARLQRWLHLVVGAGLGLAAISGVLMFVKITALTSLTRLAYTGLEVGFAVALIGSAAILVSRLIFVVTEAAPIPGRSIPASGK